jgi:alpha-tubulin suppressor-like RCC1 family protein
LTINSTSIIPYPVLTPCSFKHLDKIYSESDYNVALCNGKVYTWGCNIFSRLGQPISSSQLPKVRIPREVALPERVTKIGIGVYHAVAVGDSGAAYAWGKGNQGQLGIDHYETEVF